MNLCELAHYIGDEEKSEQALLELGIMIYLLSKVSGHLQKNG